MIAKAEFELIRLFLAADVPDFNAVVTVLTQCCMTDIHRHIRCDVVGGIVNLIQELLLARLLTDQSTAVRSFCDVQRVWRSYKMP